MDGVAPVVVMVRLGVAGALTDCGLTVHDGVPAVCTGVTAQDRATVMAEVVFTGVTVRSEVAVPLGSTAKGEGTEALRVKSGEVCPNAGASAAIITMEAITVQARS